MAQIRGDLVYKGKDIEVYFELDLAGIAKYALRSVELGGVLERMAGNTKRYAEAISPYDAGDDERDRKAGRAHYKDCWETIPYIERRTGGPPYGPMPRQAQLVINTSEHAAAVEFGNGRTGQIYGHRVFPRLFDYLAGYIP